MWKKNWRGTIEAVETSSPAKVLGLLGLLWGGIEFVEWIQAKLQTVPTAASDVSSSAPKSASQPDRSVTAQTTPVEDPRRGVGMSDFGATPTTIAQIDSAGNVSPNTASRTTKKRRSRELTESTADMDFEGHTAIWGGN